MGTALKWIPAFARMTLLISTLYFFIPTAFAQLNLNIVNQKVCDRFEEDIARLAGIMDEYRDREGITETRVAFGGIDTPVKSADYQITYAAEAIAFQRAQNYTSPDSLKYSLNVLVGKVLKAKGKVGKVLDENN